MKSNSGRNFGFKNMHELGLQNQIREKKDIETQNIFNLLNNVYPLAQPSGDAPGSQPPKKTKMNKIG